MSGNPTARLDERGLRTLSWALAFVGVFCVVSPIADWVLTNLPLELSRLTWRYQALGRLSQGLLTPVLGAAVLVVAGSIAEREWMSRAAGVLSLLGAFALVALAGVFLLDMADARTQVREEAAAIFRMGAIRAVMKFAFSAVALGLLGFAGLALAKRPEGGMERPGKAGADKVIFKSS